MEEVAYIVENDVLIHAILKEIEKNSNVELKNNSKIEAVRLQRDGYANGMVHLKSGEIYSSELLVRYICVYFIYLNFTNISSLIRPSIISIKSQFNHTQFFMNIVEFFGQKFL